MQQRSLKISKANHQRFESLVGTAEDMVFEFDEKASSSTSGAATRHARLNCAANISKVPIRYCKTFILSDSPASLIGQGSSETVASLQLGSNHYFFIARPQAVPMKAATIDALLRNCAT